MYHVYIYYLDGEIIFDYFLFVKLYAYQMGCTVHTVAKRANASVHRLRGNLVSLVR